MEQKFRYELRVGGSPAGGRLRRVQLGAKERGGVCFESVLRVRAIGVVCSDSSLPKWRHHTLEFYLFYG